ncbi:MAG: alpha-glucosidase C-terminal domain-containing protein [Chitinophagaceae bacterium]
MSPYPEFGKDLPACMFFCTVVKGMPLLYGGQEAGFNKSLFKLKHENQPLWNGGWGGKMVRIFNYKPGEIISFAREKNGDKVVSVINFSDKPVAVKLNSRFQVGTYTEYFTGIKYELKGDDELSLPA